MNRPERRANPHGNSFTRQVACACIDFLGLVFLGIVILAVAGTASAILSAVLP